MVQVSVDGLVILVLEYPGIRAGLASPDIAVLESAVGQAIVAPVFQVILVSLGTAVRAFLAILGLAAIPAQALVAIVASQATAAAELAVGQATAAAELAVGLDIVGLELAAGQATLVLALVVIPVLV